jgi:hypothetical protein
MLQTKTYYGKNTYVVQNSEQFLPSRQVVHRGFAGLTLPDTYLESISARRPRSQSGPGPNQPPAAAGGCRWLIQSLNVH